MDRERRLNYPPMQVVATKMGNDNFRTPGYSTKSGDRLEYRLNFHPTNNQ